MTIDRKIPRRSYCWCTSDEWEDTIINLLSDEQHLSRGVTSIIRLSPRKLRSIRKATGGGEAGIELAELAVEHDLTVQDLGQVRNYVR